MKLYNGFEWYFNPRVIFLHMGNLVISVMRSKKNRCIFGVNFNDIFQVLMCLKVD